MDPPFSGFVLDPSKCKKLSINQKRQLVCEISKYPESASEKLQTWTRRDLLEILCAELGKDRKYTGLSKQKMIHHLLRVVSAKNTDKLLEEQEQEQEQEQKREESQEKEENTETTPTKRARKSGCPTRVGPTKNNNSSSTRVCENIACRAVIGVSDRYCKRCSCCICYKYDENKDPSLWFFCEPSSRTPGSIEPCGASCHIECALMDRRAGIGRVLDGEYFCVQCGEVNDLLRYWKKQLIIAKDARRVDIMCHRISLSHRILSSTEKYRKLHEIVDSALKKLELEVGPTVSASRPGTARGIVSRLSVGPEVQRLCGLAIQSLATMSATYPGLEPSNFIRFEDLSARSVSLVFNLDNYKKISQTLTGFKVWARNADVAPNHPSDPTHTLLLPQLKLPLTDLKPNTNFMFKITPFSGTKEFESMELSVKTKDNNNNNNNNNNNKKDGSDLEGRTQNSSLSNHLSEGDEMNSENCTKFTDLNKSPDSFFGCNCENRETIDLEKVYNQEDVITGQTGSGLDEEPNQTGSLTIIPHGLPGLTEPDRTGNKLGSAEPGSSSKKAVISVTKCDEGDSFEYCIRVIRFLECEGHIGADFRVKFLTWFSLRATPEERKVVTVYIETLIDEPVSLAGQLVDTFSEMVSNKRSRDLPRGLCMKLWH